MLMDFLSYDGRDIILDSVADGVFTIDQDWRVTSFNRAAENITGIKRDNALGQRCKDILKADVCESGCALRQTMQTGQPVINKPVHIVDSQGRRKSITISSALLKNREGQVIGGVETFRDMTVVEELRKQLQKQYCCEDIISRSHKVQQLFDVLPRVAESDCTVLIEGETGTGKELLAQIFHNESRRRSGPFMAVNCGALPDSLLESELFGYERGAFTGAVDRREGKIEHASGGTLFLDEIEAMSPAMQVKLLRVLQDKTLQRLGGIKDIYSDFRVISATNTDPLELLNTGQLRSDLYYRLSVFQVHVPPLRDRIEDIPLLVQHIINKKKRGGRDYIKGLDDQAMKLLVSVPWFGNVRELQNVIERAVMLATREIITSDLIQIPSMPLAEGTIDAAHISEHAFRPGTTLKSYKSLLQQAAERKYLIELLEYTEGRIGESAMFAGLTPRALYNKMKIHGLKKADFRKSE